MQLTRSSNGDVEVLAPHGSVHAGDDEEFAEALAALRRERRFLLVIDAREMEYVNSRAIGQLVAFSRDARLAGGKLVMVNVPQSLAKILKAVGLLSLVPTFSSVDEAIEACTARGQ